MWTCRKMLRKILSQHVTNKVVLRTIKTQPERVTRIKISYLGHIMRHEIYDIPQLMLEGNMVGRRRIGRIKNLSLRNIRE